MLLDFSNRMRTEAHFLNTLGTSYARAKHKLYFIRMFKKRASGISKLILMAPNVHVQIKGQIFNFYLETHTTSNGIYTSINGL